MNCKTITIRVMCLANIHIMYCQGQYINKLENTRLIDSKKKNI